MTLLSFPGRLGFVLAAVLLLAGPVRAVTAWAQDEGEDPSAGDTQGEETPEEEAAEEDANAADSSAVMQVLTTLKPTYTTKYDVQRQTNHWVQEFNFGTRVGFVSFNNKTTFDVSNDSGRDEDRRNGSNRTNLQWLVIPKVPINMNVNLGRISVQRPGEERQQDNAGVTLNAVYRKQLLGVRHNFKFGGGYTRDGNISVRNEARSKSVDSGFDGNFSWDGTWVPLDPLSFTASYRDQRTNKDSRLEDENGDVQTRPTRRDNQTVTATVEYIPVTWITADLAYNDNSGNDEFFLVQAGQGFPERKESATSSTTANLSVKPTNTFDFSFNYTANDNSLIYQERTDLSSSGNGDSWEGRLKTRVLGTDTETSLSRTRSLLEPLTSPHHEDYDSELETRLTRRLSAKFNVQFALRLKTTQIYFLTGSEEERLDRDERRVRFSPTLNYTPNGRWSVALTYTQANTRRVELNPLRAAQTKKEEDFTVDVAIRYTPSTKTNISQTYSIKALYTTFDFNDVNNRLTSSQRITTHLDSQVTEHVNLFFDHRFTLTDSGPFSFEPDGSRLFARSNRKYANELTSGLDYDFSSWATFRVSSRFFRTDDVAEATGDRRISRQRELSPEFRIDRELGGGMKFTASAGPRLSDVRESYFWVTSSLNKAF